MSHGSTPFLKTVLRDYLCFEGAPATASNDLVVLGPFASGHVAPKWVENVRGQSCASPVGARAPGGGPRARKP
eukprot:3874918-Lingulodinium_polyedra.AAC.1